MRSLNSEDNSLHFKNVYDISQCALCSGIKMYTNKLLTVILACISNFLPLRLINLQVSSSTEAAVIWNTSWPLGNNDSKVLMSCFKLFRQAMIKTLIFHAKRCHAQREKGKVEIVLNVEQKFIIVHCKHKKLYKTAVALKKQRNFAKN